MSYVTQYRRSPLSYIWESKIHRMCHITCICVIRHIHITCLNVSYHMFHWVTSRISIIRHIQTCDMTHSSKLLHMYDTHKRLCIAWHVLFIGVTRRSHTWRLIHMYDTFSCCYSHRMCHITCLNVSYHMLYWVTSRISIIHVEQYRRSPLSYIYESNSKRMCHTYE